MAKKMDWFRLYPEIRRDPKIRRLNPSERWLWITLLCIASDSPERGRLLISKDLPYVVEDIADEAAMDLELIEKGIKSLEKYGLISLEEGVYFIPKWEERQYDNPSDAPSATRKRKQKSREKQKESHQIHDDVTTMSRPCHDIETESDTETDSEKELNKVVVVECDPPEEKVAQGKNQMEDPKFAQAYTAFEKQFYHAINSVQTDELGRFIDAGMEPDLIEEAVAITRKNSKDLGYFWGILENCHQQGILTITAFEEAKKEKKRRRQQQKSDLLPDYVERQINGKSPEVGFSIDPQIQRETDHMMVQLGDMERDVFHQKWGEWP